MADGTSAMSVALSRQMLWRMLGADHPMEAHKIDSRPSSHGPLGRRPRGVASFLEKRPPRFTLRPERGHAGVLSVVAASASSSSYANKVRSARRTGDALDQLIERVGGRELDRLDGLGVARPAVADFAGDAVRERDPLRELRIDRGVMVREDAHTTSSSSPQCSARQAPTCSCVTPKISCSRVSSPWSSAAKFAWSERCRTSFPMSCIRPATERVAAAGLAGEVRQFVGRQRSGKCVLQRASANGVVGTIGGPRRSRNQDAAEGLEADGLNGDTESARASRRR